MCITVLVDPSGNRYVLLPDGGQVSIEDAVRLVTLELSKWVDFVDIVDVHHVTLFFYALLNTHRGMQFSDLLGTCDTKGVRHFTRGAVAQWDDDTLGLWHQWFPLVLKNIVFFGSP